MNPSFGNGISNWFYHTLGLLGSPGGNYTFSVGGYSGEGIVFNYLNGEWIGIVYLAIPRTQDESSNSSWFAVNANKRVGGIAIKLVQINEEPIKLKYSVDNLYSWSEAPYYNLGDYLISVITTTLYGDTQGAVTLKVHLNISKYVQQIPVSFQTLKKSNCFDGTYGQGVSNLQKNCNGINYVSSETLTLKIPFSSGMASPVLAVLFPFFTFATPYYLNDQQIFETIFVPDFREDAFYYYDMNTLIFKCKLVGHNRSLLTGYELTNFGTAEAFCTL